MAARRETRSLRARARALRTSVSRLIDWDPSRTSSWEIKGRRFARFKTLLRQTMNLANTARRLNPQDHAWRYYDKDIEKIERDLTAGGFRPAERAIGVSGYSFYSLRSALEMVEGSLSRTKHPRIEEIGNLVRGMLWSQKPADRNAARQVLGDLLEETGYVGEANALKKHDWSTDRKILRSLDIEPPRYRPYSYPRPVKDIAFRRGSRTWGQ